MHMTVSSRNSAPKPSSATRIKSARSVPARTATRSAPAPSRTVLPIRSTSQLPSAVQSSRPMTSKSATTSRRPGATSSGLASTATRPGVLSRPAATAAPRPTAVVAPNRMTAVPAGRAKRSGEDSDTIIHFTEKELAADLDDEFRFNI